MIIETICSVSNFQVTHQFCQVTQQVLDEKLGRVVTRVVLPHVVMHSRYHYGVILTLFIMPEINVFLMRSMH